MNLSILNLDIGIVLFYLLLTLGVGVWKGRGVKNLKDFAIGDNKFANTALIATITATWIGGGPTIGIVERVYSCGIVWYLIFLGAVTEIFVFQLFASRIIKFKGALSVAEILGVWYGKPARVIGAICVIALSAGQIGAQIAVIGQLFREFVGITPFTGIVTAAGVVILYSAFGGIKSVTVTDFIQLAFFMAATPVIASIIMDLVGGYKGLHDNLPRDHLHITNSYGSFGEYLGFFMFFCIPFFDACLIQRVLMARDREQIKKCFLTTALIMAVFYALCSIISLSAKVIDPNLNSNDVLYHVINHYLPEGIKGLGIAGLLAVVMSTADSYLNVASVVVINDIVNPLRKKSLSDKGQLLVARATTFAIGIVAIIIALNFDSVLQIMMKSWMIWAPIVVGPLYAAFFGVRTNINTFFFGMASGLTVLVLWLVFGIEAKIGVDSMVPSLFANLAAFTLAALYYYKRAPEKLNNPILPNLEAGDLLPPKLNPKAWLRALPRRLLALIPLPRNILRFSASRVHYFGAQYKLFAAFSLVSFIVPSFLWSEPGSLTFFNHDIALVFRFVSVMLAFFLLIHELWPKRLLRYLPVYWHFNVMYSLPFITSFLFLYNQGSYYWLINVALSLFLLSVLVDWLSFIVLLIFGALGGISLYHYAVNNEALPKIFADTAASYMFLYVFLFSTVIGLLFSRNKEILQHKLEVEKAKAIKREILDNISHETRTPIQGVLTMAEFLEDDWDTMPEQKKFKLVKDLRFSAHRLMSFVHNLVDLSKYKVGKMAFELEPAHFRPLVDGVVKEAHIFYVPERNIELKVNVAPGLKDYVSLDEYKMTKLLRNVVGNAFKYIEEGTITISLSNQDDQLLFCIEDEGVGIPDSELEEIFQPFIQSSRTKTGAGGTGVGLTIARDVAIGHGGKIWAENRITKGAKFCLLLPLLPKQPRLEEGAKATESSLRALPEARQSISASGLPRRSAPRNDGGLEQEGESSNKPRVMIIDDEAVCHGALDMLLTEHCSEIICFTSAIKALAHLRENPDAADLILLDVMMPGMTGLEFLEIIRSDSKLKHIKVMMQSGNFDQEVMQRTSQLGVSGYIPKPYDKVKVVDAVREIGK